GRSERVLQAGQLVVALLGGLGVLGGLLGVDDRRTVIGGLVGGLGIGEASGPLLIALGRAALVARLDDVAARAALQRVAGCGQVALRRDVALGRGSVLGDRLGARFGLLLALHALGAVRQARVGQIVI